MKSGVLFKKGSEILFFSLLIGVVNFFLPDIPGFLNSSLNPYLLLTFVISAYYGKYYGYLSLGCSGLIILFLLPFSLNFVHPGTWSASYWQKIMENAAIPCAIALIVVYIFGVIHDNFIAHITKSKSRLKYLSRDKGILNKRIRAIEIVYKELEERISHQQESITALYFRIQRLYTLNLQKSLSAILEIIHIFAGASKASMWEYNAEEKALHLAAQVGWTEGDNFTTLKSLDHTLEGWVLRNNLSFSIKMLNQYQNLINLASPNNLFTFPITIGGQIWGVLNIEDMPFAKFNQYTEELILMILSLASVPLERSIDYESITKQSEPNPHTGFPTFSDFYSLLDKELTRIFIQKGTLSIIIMELANFETLIDEYEENKAFFLLAQIGEEINKLSKIKGKVFHYKARSQLVFLFPHLDYDGASFLCLEILANLSIRRWQINNKPVNLDTFFGYAALSQKAMKADELLDIAENLIEMQKL